MTPDWHKLDSELAHWRKAGITLPLWWRDDDAIEPTAELDRLCALSDKHSLPVHLAIIPADATPGIGAEIASRANLVPVVHGWSHQNHAPKIDKKNEFGAHRPFPQRQRDAVNGIARLTEVLGRAPVPMFVPPWNRLAPDMPEALYEIGYRALSTFAPRRPSKAAPDLLRINTHLDPIDWRGTRSLMAQDQLLGQLVQQLQDRRLGHADNAEPYGLLTHHLVHDPAIWNFCDRLLGHLMQGPVSLWSGADMLPAKGSPA